MEIEQLTALLELLKELGVEEYALGDFRIKFFPHLVEDMGDMPQPTRTKPLGNSFQHPSLWAGGEPPKFPGK